MAYAPYKAILINPDFLVELLLLLVPKSSILGLTAAGRPDIASARSYTSYQTTARETAHVRTRLQLRPGRLNKRITTTKIHTRLDRKYLCDSIIRFHPREKI